LSEVFVAPERDGSLGLQPELRNHMEYLLDARAVSGLRTSMARHSVPSVPHVVAA